MKPPEWSATRLLRPGRGIIPAGPFFMTCLYAALSLDTATVTSTISVVFHIPERVDHPDSASDHDGNSLPLSLLNSSIASMNSHSRAE